MATWEDLRAYVRETYTVSEDTGELLTLLFNVSGERKQWAYVTRTRTGGGLDFATIASPFATVGTIDLEGALHELREYVVGGVATYGDLYVVRHAVLLETINTAEFEVPLRLVLGAADALESQFAGSDLF